MWVGIVAWFKKHPALCAVGVAVLVAFGFYGKAKRLQTQRDRARHDMQDAVRATRIDEAKRRAAEAQESGDRIAKRRALIDVKREESLRKEETRHRKSLEKIEEHFENGKEKSNIVFMRNRVKRGARAGDSPNPPSAS